MRIAVVVTIMLAGGVAHGSGGFLFIPPVEVDVGSTRPIASGAVASSTDLLIGLSWASLAWKPTWFDIGVGYVGSFREAANPYAIAGSMPTSDMPATPALSLNGGYLALARTVVDGDHVRTWVSLRGELLDAQLGDHNFSALGGAVRLASELYVAGKAAAGDHGSGVAVVGALALGLYVEASHRGLPDALGPTGFTAGLTLRVPFLFAVAH